MKIAAILLVLTVFTALVFACTRKPSNEASKVLGGIESLIIEGSFCYFGFNYSSDRVISPVFCSTKEIANFAVGHMRQRDGLKSEHFWASMAEESVEYSDLASDIESRTISKHALLNGIQSVRQSMVTNEPVLNLPFNNHLQYLLDAASDWPDEFDVPENVAASASKFGLDEDDFSPWFDDSIRYLSNVEELPEGATYSDAANVFIWFFEYFYLGKLHSNWQQVLFGEN